MTETGVNRGQQAQVRSHLLLAPVHTFSVSFPIDSLFPSPSWLIQLVATAIRKQEFVYEEFGRHLDPSVPEHSQTFFNDKQGRSPWCVQVHIFTNLCMSIYSFGAIELDCKPFLKTAPTS